MTGSDEESSVDSSLGGRVPRERRRRPRRFQREIGCLGDGQGPLLVVTGGIHGNESGGYFALERVVANLQERGLVPRGTLLALGGNLPALELGERYLEIDLNRMWTVEQLESARATEQPSHEQRQLLDIHARITSAIEAANGPVAFLDLHSASAEGSPFALMGDTLANRELAFEMGLPVILGLEENVDGTLLSWFGELGHVAVGVEGGQHLDENTTRHQEACVWTALAAVGLLEPRQLPWLPEQQRLLRRASAGLPRFVAVSHRHGIAPDDHFRMVPGYVNFDRVDQGDVLAHDVSGPIQADFTGNILLPLYQGRGADGFFLGKPVRRFWLQLSALLRRTGLDYFLSWLPGVSRDPERADALWIDRRIARLRALDLFHLFGYWRLDEKGPRLRVARRREKRGAR